MQDPVIVPESSTASNHFNAIDPSAFYMNYSNPYGAMSQYMGVQPNIPMPPQQAQMLAQMTMMVQQQHLQQQQQHQLQQQHLLQQQTDAYNQIKSKPSLTPTQLVHKEKPYAPESPSSSTSASASQASDFASMLNDTSLLPFTFDDFVTDPCLSPKSFSSAGNFHVHAQSLGAATANANHMYYGLGSMAIPTPPMDASIHGSPGSMQGPESPESQSTGQLTNNPDQESVPKTSPRGSIANKPIDIVPVNKPVGAEKRNLHLAAEQKRRNQIRNGFQDLQNMIPVKGQAGASGKFSKATVLHKAVDYISYLMREKTGIMTEIDKVRKEVQHLREIITEYQEMVKSGAGSEELDAKLASMQTKTRQMQSQDGAKYRDSDSRDNFEQNARNYDTENIKFYVFCCVIDALFESFNEIVSLENAEDFSLSLMSWFEQYCTPDTLRTTFVDSMQTIVSRLFSEEQTKTLRRVSGAITACKEVMVTALDNSSVPYAKKLGRTIDYVGSICSLDTLESNSVLRVSPANASI
ncbi:hypothetical protein SARC_06202 [Sphaeroforma arctica JP610]|uniref:BHLH domain-containing protein n=1 Tax=Sphaeroforma arctica JP610 TaxID=667725 RepID=A0A0L0FZS5_9EUKA|nr:hypothetical protein SARC_06202 [Sphaeroforma arctica JP610]KNC81473.1 hypothetical protein SARC_06202 [Sphaeroforma arctica JP610]|eukprot:XP_014155375.1 hypothetical protein SARC_06202 [Sphaeroforma arctica JP610]